MFLFLCCLIMLSISNNNNPKKNTFCFCFLGFCCDSYSQDMMCTNLKKKNWVLVPCTILLRYVLYIYSCWSRHYIDEIKRQTVEVAALKLNLLCSTFTREPWERSIPMSVLCLDRCCLPLFVGGFGYGKPCGSFRIGNK